MALTFEQVYESEYKKMRGVVVRHMLRTGNGDYIDDVMQEVLTKVWRSLDQLQNVQALESWCFMVARTQCLMFLRSGARQKKNFAMMYSEAAEIDPRFGAGYEDKDEVEDYVSRIATPGPNPEQALEISDIMDKSRRILRFVPQYIPIFEGLLEGAENNELAKELRRTPSAIKAQRCRMRKLLMPLKEGYKWAA